MLFLSAAARGDLPGIAWNQLDLFGLAGGFRELRDDQVPRRAQEGGRGPVPRPARDVHANRGREHTGPQRCEPRHPINTTISSPCRTTWQRLLVALVQKKVSELLSGKQFNHSFQIGMLASFESFLETAKLRRQDDEESIFDDSSSPTSPRARGIGRSRTEPTATGIGASSGAMPHPKMDAVVDSLRPRG